MAARGKTRFVRGAALLAVSAGALLGVAVLAQDEPAYQDLSDEGQKDWLTQFVEDQLSTPERQIRLSNLDGVLGSDVAVSEITIADEEGIWLRVNNAQLNWNQAALFLGRLEVRSLSADSIEYLRNPEPAVNAAPDIPTPEARGFEVPQLPVAVVIENLSVPRVTFGESVFGLGSAIALEGQVTLEGGNLDAELDILRLDGPGGTLDLDVAYTAETEFFDLAFVLNEPENGILANLLNLEGRPEVQLSVAGAGPISDLVADLAFDTAGQRALTGQARLMGEDTGLRIDVDLGGNLAPLVAEPYRPLLGNESQLAADAVLQQSGGILIERVSLTGGQLVLNASGETAPDGFLRRLEAAARIADVGGGRVVLPVPGADTTLEDAELAISFGADATEDWTAIAVISGLATPNLNADRIALTLSGIAVNLDDPAGRRVTVNGDAVISGITGDAAVEAALGDEIGLGVAALWEAGQPISVPELRIAGAGIEALATGTIAEATFLGRLAIATESIAPFSGLAGRDIDGRLTLDAEGSISPLIGGFDLTLAGLGEGLRLDDALVDRLLDGEVSISGRLARTTTGVEAENFRLGNARLEMAADGTFSSTDADFAFDLSLADLALLTDQATGALKATGRAQGSDGSIALRAEIAVPQGRLLQRELRAAQLGFNGILGTSGIDGTIDGTARLDGLDVLLNADIASGTEGTRVSNLDFAAPGARLTGDLSQDRDGLVTGRLDLDASDISGAAALALVEASGSVRAVIALSPVDGEQGATLDGDVTAFRYEGVRVGDARVSISGRDMFDVPLLSGTLDGTNISAGGLDIATLSATAEQMGEATRLDAAADLATGARVQISGDLSEVDGGFRLGLDSVELVQGAVRARLVAPGSLTIAGQNVTLQPLVLAVGSGRVNITGSAGERIDLNVAVSAFPLSLANAVVPSLGLAGTLDGTAHITGSGSDPRVTFSAEGRGLDAAAVAGLGVAPFTIAARGAYADNIVVAEALDVRGATGLALSGSGRVPLVGSGLNLTLDGSAPLALANRFLADRGGQASGTLTIAASIGGSLNAPQFSGTVTTVGAGYIDAETSLRLVNINARIALSGTQARVETFSAGLATGGAIAGSGTIGLIGQFPADLSLSLDSARYSDGATIAATASGQLAVTGNLLGNPLLSGSIFVERAEIGVPEGLGAGEVLLDVTHRAPPPPVVRTLDRAHINPAGVPTPAARAPGLLLDVTINAPNQIFVRGRGLDAEVGGSVRILGPMSNIQPVGAFNLLRGRLALLGQRIEFESGSVTLVGDLDPLLNFVARTQGDDITVFITISGRVSNIDVDFTSNPALPQDEVLSRLIFNRAMGELSPLQIARLAAAVAELAGGGGGPLDSLRGAAGLADLDVVTDEAGNVGVSAGTYIQDNVYVGVTAGANGQSRVTINLDVTDDLKITGAASQNGNSSLGIYYERDY